MDFKVRQISSAEGIAAVFTERGAEQGWRPGALDYASFFSADESGFFAGELDGKVISCLSVVKYSKHYAFVGQYVVDEPYRGKGYGLATWKFSFSSVPDGCNCGLDASEQMVPMYRRCGFKPELRVQRTLIEASTKKLECFSPVSVTLKPVTQVPLKEICEYDMSVHAYPRASFLEKWISARNCHSYAAIGQEGGVVGYAVVRSAFRKEDGWRVGPVYADNSQIARSLYRAMIQKVATIDPGAVMVIDIPYGDHCNPEGLAIAEELSGESEIKLFRMYTKGIPSNMSFNKMFGITSPELD